MELITKQLGALTCQTASHIPVPHCFTSRLGGVSTGTLASLNLGIRRGDTPAHVAENYARLGRALGFDVRRLVCARQVHSDIVRRVGPDDCGQYLWPDVPECDALITDTPDMALAVFTADCTPILLYDPVTGAVGAVHAGWRGTASGIAGKTVAAMAEAYGCDPADLRCAIGPHIGQCCFETDRDVPEAMCTALGPEAQAAVQAKGDKFYVNLTQLNTLVLHRAGVRHIETSSHCTGCMSRMYWSHRRHGSGRGAQGAIIVCKGGADRE